MVKGLPAMQETQVQSLGQEHPLEKEMATHSSIFAWKIPWTVWWATAHGVAKNRTRLSDFTLNKKFETRYKSNNLPLSLRQNIFRICLNLVFFNLGIYIYLALI